MRSNQSRTPLGAVRTNMSDQKCKQMETTRTDCSLEIQGKAIWVRNFTGDETCYTGLLDLFDRMEKAKWPSQRSLKLTTLPSTPDGAPDYYRISFARELLLKHPKSFVPDGFWELTEEDRVVKLVLGIARLNEFRNALVKRMNDAWIGVEKDRLWIW